MWGIRVVSDLLSVPARTPARGYDICQSGSRSGRGWIRVRAVFRVVVIRRGPLRGLVRGPGRCLDLLGIRRPWDLIRVTDTDSTQNASGVWWRRGLGHTLAMGPRTPKSDGVNPETTVIKDWPCRSHVDDRVIVTRQGLLYMVGYVRKVGATGSNPLTSRTESSICRILTRPYVL
jgi:hypothetical protein